MVESSDSDWRSLLSTPAAVVRYLRHEPLLLAGMGAAVLIAIIAVFAPGGSAIYAYVIAAVVFAACLLWAVSGALRHRAEAAEAARSRPRAPGIEFSAGGRSSVTDLQAATEGDASTSIVADGRATVRNVTLNSRTATVPAPRPATPGPSAPAPPGPATSTPPGSAAPAWPGHTTVASPEPVAWPEPAASPDPAAPAELAGATSASAEAVASDPPVSSASARSAAGSLSAKPTAHELFVGRFAERETVARLLSGSVHGTVIDVVGPHGAGKSVLLDRLAVEAAGRPGRIIRRLNLAEMVDGYRDDRGAGASLAVLVHTLVQSGQLLRALAGGAPGELFDAVWARVDDGHRAMPAQVLVDTRMEVRDNARAEGITVVNDVNLSVSDERLKGEIRAAQAGIDSAFVQAWGRYTNGSRVLVTIDSFDRCADDELGNWLVRLALRLPDTLVVLARTPSREALGVESERLLRWSLGNFTRDEVDAYFTRRLRGAVLDPAVVELVHDYTGGHPGGVYLLGELINERDAERLSVRDLRRLLARLPDDPDRAWADLVDEILTNVRERSSVRALAVVGSFDQALLIDLLAAVDDTVAPDAASALINRLHGVYRLIRPNPDSPSEFRMHEFVRRAIGQRLRAENPIAWQKMHAAAASYYFGRLLECEDGADGDGGYQCWYRYENVAWQRHKREWLYHAGQLVERRALTRAQFALVFLEAFWWYGCYHPFDFNRRMIEDWERTSAAWHAQGAGLAAVDAEAHRDEQFGEALVGVLNAYPTGYVKPADAPWEQIGDQLRLIRRISEPPRGRTVNAEHAAAHARVSAMVDIFLAHTCRYADLADPTADRYYASARAGFTALEDAWTVAWIDLESAELAVERGQREQAQRLLATAAQGAVESGREDTWDHELVANLHRVRADLHWQSGQPVAAAENQALAVAHAYWFQGIPHAPDAYTQQFYREQTARAAGRLLELSGDPAGALAFARVLASAVPAATPASDEAIAAAVAAGVADALAGVLFPVGPTAAELRLQEGTGFMLRWERARDIADEAADPAPRLLALVGADQPD